MTRSPSDVSLTVPRVAALSRVESAIRATSIQRCATRVVEVQLARGFGNDLENRGEHALRVMTHEGNPPPQPAMRELREHRLGVLRVGLPLGRRSNKLLACFARESCSSIHATSTLVSRTTSALIVERFGVFQRVTAKAHDALQGAQGFPMRQLAALSSGIREAVIDVARKVANDQKPLPTTRQSVSARRQPSFGELFRGNAAPSFSQPRAGANRSDLFLCEGGDLNPHGSYPASTSS